MQFIMRTHRSCAFNNFFSLAPYMQRWHRFSCAHVATNLEVHHVTTVNALHLQKRMHTVSATKGGFMTDTPKKLLLMLLHLVTETGLKQERLTVMGDWNLIFGLLLWSFWRAGFILGLLLLRLWNAGLVLCPQLWRQWSAGFILIRLLWTLWSAGFILCLLLWRVWSARFVLCLLL